MGKRKGEIPQKINLLIHQSNLIEGFDSEEADTTSMYAWSKLRHANQATEFMGQLKPYDLRAINNTAILRLHKNIASFQGDTIWPGAYRDRSRVQVRIGDRFGLEPALIQAAMEEWIRLLPTRTPKEAHIEFEIIHPFIDGNGRTGRMLMWYHERSLGQKLTYVSKEKVDEYYSWFKQ